MRRDAIHSLVFPGTSTRFEVGRVDAESGGEIQEGMLVTRDGNKSIPIRNCIPRFVPNSSYTSNFGLQWNHFRRTQLDRFNGTTISSDRFYSSTGWSHQELQGQRILEVGCGAGRFTQVMLDAGAEVWSLDYSTAVDACWGNNGPHPKLCVVQGNLYDMPFERSSFDKVLCFGVLQHTPDVKRAFMSLPSFLKPHGKLAVDFYRKEKWPTRWTSKYLWRPLTKRMPNELLFKFVAWYVPRWLPFDNRLDEMTFFWRFAKYVRGIMPCWNYAGMLPLTDELLKEWAVLDTFDALSPTYDQPQSIDVVRPWFQEAGLSNVNVRHGDNGIVGCGVKPKE